MYIFELSSPKKRKMRVKYLERRGFKNPRQVNTGKYSFHFEAEVEDEDLKKAIRRCKRRRLTYFYYDKQFARASNYRKRFFDAYKPPYRCQYCHKRLKEGSVTVDHLIPVDAAKKSLKAQKLILKNGFDGVNDIRNLVPSCAECNRRKGNKTGLWYIRGKLGFHKSYWYVRRIVKTIFAAAVLLFFAVMINFIAEIIHYH